MSEIHSESGAGGPQTYQRLACLYEISKLLMHIERVEETVQATITIMAQALVMRCMVLVVQTAGPPKIISWPRDEAETSWVREATARALAAYTYFVDAASRAPGAPEEPLKLKEVAPGDRKPYILLPLAVESRPVFGVLHVDGATEANEQDLMFVNAIVNQFAIALEWNSTLTAREAMAIDNARLFKIAERESRTRKNLLSAVSHDLRNSLSAISMSTALLLRDLPLEVQGRRPKKNLEIIQRSVIEMNRLIEDLLDTASIEAGHLALNMEPHAVKTILGDAVQTQEAQAASQSISLKSEFAGDGLQVMCDPQRIQQVFSNLIGNALKFTPAGGAITLKAEAHDPMQVRFAVSDTGTGISLEDMPNLFERFFQGTRKENQGIGLGLVIAKGIVEAHGGRIWIESKPGEGTTVYFTLQRSEPGA
jgi:signal transduction histidine kinase